MSDESDKKQSDTEIDEAQRSTQRLSQEEQARGYLKSLADHDYVEEIRNGLVSARRLTRKEWVVMITADGLEIYTMDEVGPAVDPEDGDENAS